MDTLGFGVSSCTRKNLSYSTQMKQAQLDTNDLKTKHSKTGPRKPVEGFSTCKHLQCNLCNFKLNTYKIIYKIIQNHQKGQCIQCALIILKSGARLLSIQLTSQIPILTDDIHGHLVT